MNEPRYRHLLENVPGPIPISEAFHLYLIDLLRGAFVENFAAQQLMAHFLDTGCITGPASGASTASEIKLSARLKGLGEPL